MPWLGLKIKKEINELKDKIINKYSEKLYIGSPQKSDYAKWFSTLRQSFEGKPLYEENSFAYFSLDFMRFLLYRHLSKQKEDDLVDLLFSSPHKKELKDIAEIAFGRPVGQLIKTYLEEKAERTERKVLITGFVWKWKYVRIRT